MIRVRPVSVARAARLLEGEIVPVVGCTEPASIAFALRQARLQLGDAFALDDAVVELRLSPDVRRNASTAVVPFVRKRGLEAVAAAGLVAEGEGFDPFAGLGDRRVDYRRLTLRRGWLKTKTLSRRGLYLTVLLRSRGREVSVTVSGRHDRIASLRCDRETLRRTRSAAAERPPSLAEAWSLARARSAKLERIAAKFLKEQVEGDRKHDVATRVAALIRGRMTGENLRVVTLTGSGNQGIFLGVPLRELVRAEGRRALPAVVFALLVQVHLTRRHSRLSGACGIATKAAPALAAGYAFHAGMNPGDIRRVMAAVTARLDTLRCPGALPSCAAKARQALAAIEVTLEDATVAR